MNSIAKRFYVGLFVIFVVGMSLIWFFTFQLTKVSTLLEKDVPKSVQNLKEDSRLDGLAQFIRYYDEVLTQSARNYAFTADVKWKDRYNSIVPELDKIIKEAVEKGDEQDKGFFAQVDASNLALVDMEVASISLVDAGRSSEAAAILESQAYADQKKIYEGGLRAYVAKRGESYDQALEASTLIIDKVNKDVRDVVKKDTQLMVILGVLTIFLMVGISLFLVRSISVPLKHISDTANTIAQGDLSKRIAVTSKDEIGQLAASFNEMVSKLQQSQGSLEAQVNERTKQLEEKMQQLEEVNRVMVGREITMIELKKENERLKAQHAVS